MITNSVDLYKKAFPHAQVCTGIDGNGTVVDISECPWCGEKSLQLYHDLNFYTCTNCKRNGSSFGFCIDALNLNGEELVRFIIEKDGALDCFDYFDFWKCIHKKRWDSSEVEIIKPYGWDLAPWEKQETCQSCNCPYFIYKTNATNVACFCCFCGRKIGALHKTSVKQNGNRANLYNDWRREVYKRWGGRCAMCGAEKDLHAHHIIAHSVCEEYRYKINNGILLCKKCHELAHKKPNVFTYHKG